MLLRLVLLWCCKSSLWWFYLIHLPYSSELLHWHWCKHMIVPVLVKSLRPRQNCRHFTDDIFKCIFLNGNAWFSLSISLKFVPRVWINNIPVQVQIMAWRQPSDRSLFESMVVSLLTHICNELGRCGVNFTRQQNATKRELCILILQLFCGLPKAAAQSRSYTPDP